MINPGGFSAAALALAVVLMSPADGLAQSKVNEHSNEHAPAPPRPPMRTYRPGTVAAPAAGPNRDAAPAPPALAKRPNDHDGNRDAFAAGVAAGVVLGRAAAAPGIYNVPAPSPADDPVAYCAWMYSSYDPQSGTYVGDDGNLHSCP
jgi:hypothetical protein